MLAANSLQRLLPNPEKPLARPFDDLFPLAISAVGMPPSPKHGINSIITTILSPVLYGLVHFLARSDHFPTRLECLLWQISSAVVAGSGLLVHLVTSIYVMLEPIIATTFLDGITFLVGIMIPSAHVLASGFLIGESFRQLFFLGPAAYQLPSWANYWPHVSI